MDAIGHLVVGAVLLLVKGLAVKGARRSGDAGQDRQSEKRGNKGFHDHSPRLFGSVWCESFLLAVHHMVDLAPAKRWVHAGVMNSDQFGNPQRNGQDGRVCFPDEAGGERLPVRRSVPPAPCGV